MTKTQTPDTLATLVAIIDFNTAAKKLVAALEKSNVDGDQFCKDYPFNESFDEIQIKINTWYRTCLSSKI